METPVFRLAQQAAEVEGDSGDHDVKGWGLQFSELLRKYCQFSVTSYARTMFWFGRHVCQWPFAGCSVHPFEPLIPIRLPRVAFFPESRNRLRGVPHAQIPCLHASCKRRVMGGQRNVPENNWSAA